MSENAVTVILPARRFVGVARLVAAGFASQFPLGVEAIDDLQLAIELVLRAVPAESERTVSLATAGESLMVELGPYAAGALEQSLRRFGREGSLELGRVLGQLVDRVEVVRRPSAFLVLGVDVRVRSA